MIETMYIKYKYKYFRTRSDRIGRRTGARHADEDRFEYQGDGLGEISRMRDGYLAHFSRSLISFFGEK